MEHDLNTWTDHPVEARDHVNIDEFELDFFFAFFFYGMCFWSSVLKPVHC